ncbi:MbnP family protein [Winogradskyella helgolandensis]|uniref:MbnP family protein n=1 Tax=Winogradskyella helgolandensis TaxID=2697010 RepID=UPI0015C91FAF|nr:MbnP family protein [Winogradskyella helgolandensis]
MKNLKTYILSAAVLVAFMSCSSDDEDNRVANNVTLEFNNTFGNTPIVLGDATSTSATVNTSDAGQTHHFEELKYVISNIRLIKADGTEIPYNVNDLDNGATVVNQANSETLSYVLSEIPVGDYTEIKFGLGVRSDLNTLDQVSFPNFYNNAGSNETEMHWEWGTGYRFTKLEGFYDTDNKTLSFHSGSTLEGEEGNYTQGVNAYRDITLALPTTATVGNSAPTITIKADFDYFLSGDSHTVTLVSTEDITNNATPSAHTATEMMKFVENIGGNGTTDLTGMFSITSVE